MHGRGTRQIPGGNCFCGRRNRKTARKLSLNSSGEEARDVTEEKVGCLLLLLTCSSLKENFFLGRVIMIDRFKSPFYFFTNCGCSFSIYVENVFIHTHTAHSFSLLLFVHCRNFLKLFDLVCTGILRLCGGWCAFGSPAAWPASSSPSSAPSDSTSPPWCSSSSAWTGELKTRSKVMRHAGFCENVTKQTTLRLLLIRNKLEFAHFEPSSSCAHH